MLELTAVKDDLKPLPSHMESKDIILWGGGFIGAIAARTLQETQKIAAVCDNDISKHGKMIEGLPCIPPSKLMGYRDPFVLISTTSKYRKAIRSDVEKRGIQCCSIDNYVIQKYYSNFEEVYRMLDARSKEIYANVLLGRISDKHLSNFETICSDDQYFCLPKFRYLEKQEGAFIDCGAYVGDTVESMVKNSLGAFYRIYAFEPSDRALAAMNKRIEILNNIWGLDSEQIVCEKKAVGLKYGTAALRNSSDLRLLDTYVSENAEAENDSDIEIVSLDAYLKSQRVEKVSLIKADIEGFEWDMLHGAEETIRREKPMLAICLYHNIFDFFRIPLYLKELVPEYQFHIRHHSLSELETVLYCFV